MGVDKGRAARVRRPTTAARPVSTAYLARDHTLRRGRDGVCDNRRSALCYLLMKRRTTGTAGIGRAGLTILVALGLSCAIAAGSARAAEPPAEDQVTDPPLIDRKGASRVRPEADAFDTLSIKKEPLPPKKEPKPDEPYVEEIRYGIGAHGRFVYMPDFLLDAFFDTHPVAMSYGVGISVLYGDPRTDVYIFELDYIQAKFAPQNWREKGVLPLASTWADVDLHILSLDFTYRDIVLLGEPVDFFYGAGIGILALIGDVRTAEVLPTCDHPISQCGHWSKATHGSGDLPSRIWPVIHLTLGLQFRISDAAVIRLEGGLRPAPTVFAGLSANFLL